MGKLASVKVAAVQAAPIFFDLNARLDKAAGIIADAAAQGCDLVAYGEAWFPYDEVELAR